MKKQDARRLPPAAQAVLRLRIADFLKGQKGTRRQAAYIFQLSLRAVEKIWKQFKEGGVQALKPKKRGPHQSRSRLSAKKAKQVRAIIKKDLPEQHHIPRYLWTAAVRELLKKSPGKLQCTVNPKAITD